MKLKKADCIFAIALVVVLLFHISQIFLTTFWDDEAFYASISLRLVNGDSLIQDEWHLSQFSSLFSYFPVYLWSLFSASGNGLILFLRFFYLAIHTIVTVVVYRFFREYGVWSVAAAMCFFAHIPYVTYAISYQSMFAIFCLLLCLSLVKAYKTNLKRYGFFAGCCYAACCVNNPLFCIAFVLYLLIFFLWSYKNKIINLFFKGEKIEKIKSFGYNYVKIINCFFSKRILIYSLFGIVFLAIICITFFLFTGGTFNSLFNNISNLLSSSEYGIISFNIGERIKTTVETLNNIGPFLMFLLPFLFLIIFSDKKRTENTNKFVYLLCALVIFVVYMSGMLINNDLYGYITTLPFLIFSFICYILTKNKNRILFIGMWCTCVFAAFFNWLACNTVLVSPGVVLIGADIAGVIFAHDFYKEMVPENNVNPKEKIKITSCKLILCGATVFQIIYFCVVMMSLCGGYKNTARISEGPYTGIYMDQEQVQIYDNTVKDLNYIKKISREDDPVLIVSESNWEYLYIERPFATPMHVASLGIDCDVIETYLKLNKEKTPRYIYLNLTDVFTGSQANDNKDESEKIVEMFECTEQELSSGILYIIESEN